MDPTTKEGRSALRHIHAQMLAEAGTAKASGCTPSAAPTVRWMTAASDHLLATLSHIESLEGQIASMRTGLGASLDVALRERNEFLTECATLRADLERAREALRLAAAQMAGMAIALRNLAPGDPCKTADQMDAWAREAERSALSPSPAPVETPPAPYEPSEAEVRSALAEFDERVEACRLTKHRPEERDDALSDGRWDAMCLALIAAHNARSSEP